MKITCELGTKKVIELDWSSLYRSTDYIELKFSEPLPVELEENQFIRILEKGKVVFEGYVSEFNNHSFKLVSYFRILKTLQPQDIK